ncbi:unnamed protein product [Amoebophrya sp. A25]|nr:unnamed protein product [Amoebophrya sp. A25]|eukprot:GSA25T00007159001.1
MTAPTDDQIAQFMSITGLNEHEQAKSYLEMSNANLETAVTLFFDSGGNAGAGGGGTGGPPPGTGGDFGGDFPVIPPEDDDVRAPIAAYQDQIIGSAPGGRSRDAEAKAHQERLEKDHKDMLQRMTFAQQEGTSSSSNDKSKTGGGAKAKEHASAAYLNKIFATPSYSEIGSFADAINRAMNEEKFLLVNLQSKDEFASWQLNRDIWNNELVQDLVSQNFVFWQKDNVSDQGKMFASYYKITSFPHICFIDPRTKRSVKSWDGKKWSDSTVAVEMLTGFADKHSLSGGQRPPPPPAAFANGPVSGSSASTGNPPGSGGPPIAISSSSGGTLSSSSSSSSASGALTTGGDSSALVAGGQGGISDASTTGTVVEVVGDDPAAKKAKHEDVPPLPEEPADSENPVKLTLRLLDGRRSNPIKVLPTHPLSRVFQTAAHLCVTGIEDIDLFTAFPVKSLRSGFSMNATVAETGIAGTMLNVRPTKT